MARLVLIISPQSTARARWRRVLDLAIGRMATDIEWFEIEQLSEWDAIKSRISEIALVIFEGDRDRAGLTYTIAKQLVSKLRGTRAVTVSDSSAVRDFMLSQTFCSLAVRDHDASLQGAAHTIFQQSL